MYKTVRQGETSLQYRILPQEDLIINGNSNANSNSINKISRIKRLRRNRIACVLIISLIVGCVTVAAAVIVPILLTTNIIALPAKFQTFTVQTKHGKYNLQGTQYIAILPVKETNIKEIKIFQAAAAAATNTEQIIAAGGIINTNGASVGVNQQHLINQTHEKSRALFLSTTEDWPSLPAWKAIGAGRLIAVVISLCFLIIVLTLVIRRKYRQQTDQELGWSLQGGRLLSENEDD